MISTQHQDRGKTEYYGCLVLLGGELYQRTRGDETFYQAGIHCLTAKVCYITRPSLIFFKKFFLKFILCHGRTDLELLAPKFSGRVVGFQGEHLYIGV